MFDPFELEIGITPETVKEQLRRKEYSTALMMSLKLNETIIIREVVEAVPHTDSELYF